MTTHLHAVTTTDPGEPMFAWVTPDGDPLLIGEHAVVVALAAAIANYMAGDLGEPLSEYDPAWGHTYSIADAVAEALDAGYTDDPAQMANTIRAAAAGGRIRGASQDPRGRWRLPKRTFRHWLSSSRPKPRSK